MANTKSAEKAARQAVKHRARNISLRSRSRSAIRDAVETIAKGDKTAAPAAVRKAASSVDSLVNKGLVHKNKASRHKKRLAAKLKKLAGK
ncbi:MAG: 30S ribosomal protein S20 [Steroidobacteraceae bacterium]